jgi:hypothetical protein
MFNHSPINSYDIDGVIFINNSIEGVYPGPNDIIITGRSFEEYVETISMLEKRNIFNKVFFNNLQFHEKTRESSGIHKAQVLNKLKNIGIKINCHFEDDPIQKNIIEHNCGSWLNVIHLDHNLTEKENVRHEA